MLGTSRLLLILKFSLVLELGVYQLSLLVDPAKPYIFGERARVGSENLSLLFALQGPHRMKASSFSHHFNIFLFLSVRLCAFDL